ncbi:MAG: hypothetical protein Q4C80_06080 [Bacillota bacterium]|nr:hypothetical protein [Bacillota bacterium]
MTDTKFKIITGGLLTPVSNKRKQLKSAYVTDTRLMGVLAIHAHFILEDEPERRDFHQFYYIDCEEGGLEVYRSVRSDDYLDAIGELQEIEQSMIGGLGAKKIDLDEDQLASIICYYTEFNREHGIPQPKGAEEYSFLIERGDRLTDDQKKSLLFAMFGPIHSNYQVINYFLMRCIGHDYRAAAYLTCGNFPLDIYDRFIRASFCKNVIDLQREHEDGTCEYLCESLVEQNGQYETLVSHISVKNLKVVEFHNCSSFKISSAEAAMMLSKPEFVTVYEVMLSDEDIDDNIGELTVTFNTVMSIHDNGRLFMAFKDNNAHVDSSCFMLSNDVNGIYYLTDFGQLIVAAYSLHEIRYMENKLRMSPLSPYIMITGKYEFKEPIIYEFINSDFEDFDDFLNAIKE